MGLKCMMSYEVKRQCTVVHCSVSGKVHIINTKQEDWSVCTYCWVLVRACFHARAYGVEFPLYSHRAERELAFHLNEGTSPV